MASGCVPGSGGRQADRKSLLIRFIVDIPLRLVYGMRD